MLDFLNYRVPTPKDPFRLRYKRKFSLERLVVNLRHRLHITWRDMEFAFQRLVRRQRGWDDSDVWDLYTHLAATIYPKLLRFQQLPGGHPGCLTAEEWVEELGKMTEAFRMIASYEDFDPAYDAAKVQEGLDSFRKYFLSLWI